MEDDSKEYSPEHKEICEDGSTSNVDTSKMEPLPTLIKTDGFLEKFKKDEFDLDALVAPTSTSVIMSVPLSTVTVSDVILVVLIVIAVCIACLWFWKRWQNRKLKEVEKRTEELERELARRQLSQEKKAEEDKFVRELPALGANY